MQKRDNKQRGEMGRMHVDVTLPFRLGEMGWDEWHPAQKQYAELNSVAGLGCPNHVGM